LQSPAQAEEAAGLDEVELLAELIATPSESGSEEAVARLVEEKARSLGLAVVRDDAAVRIEVDSGTPGRTLAFLSHLDVAPAGDGWSYQPFSPTRVGSRLYGRGSCDAKASVAAMLCAALDVKRAAGCKRGRLVLLLGYSEETRDTTMGRALARSGRIDAAVVGEPTSLDFAVAQRGLMVLTLIARGEQRHAAHAGAADTYESAVMNLCRDLLLLPQLLTERPHALLGQPTMTPTQLEAFVARNVAPPVAKALIDVRTTPCWPPEDVAAELRRRLRSEVVVESDRLRPCETPPGSRLFELARKLRAEAKSYASPTCSDWVFLRDVDAVKIGPGASQRSHTPDEWIDVQEVSAARRFFAELATEYLS
jgi:acetylornithine deacetylase